MIKGETEGRGGRENEVEKKELKCASKAENEKEGKGGNCVRK